MRHAGVIELQIGGRGPKSGYVFDPHRLALPCWADVEPPSLLLTFDRHFDTVRPKFEVPAGLEPQQYDAIALNKLDHRNFDHILGAMSAELISDVIIVARAKPVGAVTTSFAGHEFITAPTLDIISAEWGTPLASPEGKRAYSAVERASTIILDVDLDCFTTPSDADPTSVIPWSLEVIRDFLLPRGSEAFWNSVLPKCQAFTFAREPSHCGGLIAAGRLFEHASQVIFAELFETDLP
jgi:hypothetical protein